MATNDPPIEDPYRRSKRVVPVRPTRRIGVAVSQPVNGGSSTAIPITGQPPAPFPSTSSDTPLSTPLPAAPRATPSRDSAFADRRVSTAEIPVAQPLLKETAQPFLKETAQPSLEETSQPLPDKTPQPPARPERNSHPRPDASGHRESSSYTAPLTITILSAILLGYAFNIASIQAAATNAIANLSNSADGQASAGLSFLASAIPWILLIPVVALFYAIMKALASAIGLSRKDKTETTRRRNKRPLDEFKKATAHYGISSRTAYQAYLLLQPYLHEGETPEHSATLEDEMGMTPAQVRELHLSLLRATERESDASARLPHVHTLLDLLTVTQQAPKLSRPELQAVFDPGDPFRNKR